jgi:hypothetical protein
MHTTTHVAPRTKYAALVFLVVLQLAGAFACEDCAGAEE